MVHERLEDTLLEKLNELESFQAALTKSPMSPMVVCWSKAYVLAAVEQVCISNKPQLPEAVATQVKKYQEKGLTVTQMFIKFMNFSEQPEDIKKWAFTELDLANTLALACKFGYTVFTDEDEVSYKFILKNKSSAKFILAKVKTTGMFIFIEDNGNISKDDFDIYFTKAYLKDSWILENLDMFELVERPH